jgi:hypothetical protein
VSLSKLSSRRAEQISFLISRQKKLEKQQASCCCLLLLLRVREAHILCGPSNHSFISFHSLQAEGKGSSSVFLPKNSTFPNALKRRFLVFPRNLVNTELPEARDPHDEMNGLHTNKSTDSATAEYK